MKRNRGSQLSEEYFQKFLEYSHKGDRDNALRFMYCTISFKSISKRYFKNDCKNNILFRFNTW
jgi:hypothetical protein